MKKLIAMMMALTIVVSLAACGAKNETENTTAITENTLIIEEDIVGTTNNNAENNVVVDDASSALTVLEPIWMGLGAEHQPAAYGGHFSEEYMSGPATYELTYAEDLAATLLLPTDQLDSIADAATVVHLLNANSMTVGVVKLKEGTDVKAFADATAERITNNQWMCGFPERMAIVQINEEFLFIGYGLFDMIDPMVENMDQTWTLDQLYNVSLVTEEPSESEEA